MRNVKAVDVVMVVAVLAAVTSCSGGGASTPDSPSTAAVQGASAFFHDTLQDWVSYATELVVVDVVSERAIASDTSVRESGEGYVGRRVTLRVVDQLWRAADGRDLSGQLEVDALGWVLTEGKRRPMVARGGLRLAPDRRYLMPLTIRDGQPVPLSEETLWFVDEEGRLVAPPDADNDVRALHGRRASDVGELFRATPPDAAASRHAHLPPYERVRAVLDERDAVVGSRP